MANNDLDFDELDKAVNGYMQKRRRGSAAKTSPSNEQDLSIPELPAGPPEEKAEAPAEAPVPVIAKPVAEEPVNRTKNPPSIHLERRHSINYRNDIIHDIAPPRPLPSHAGRTLKPANPTSEVEEAKPETEQDKRPGPQHDGSPLSSLFGHAKAHEAAERPDASSDQEETAFPADKPATGKDQGTPDALAEDLGNEKKAFEEQESQAAANLKAASPPETEMPAAEEPQDGQPAADDVEQKPAEPEAKQETSEPTDEADKLLPEGPHSVASPATKQVPRESAEHPVDLFDTKQYHTPLSTAAPAKKSESTSALKWVLIIVVCLAAIGLGVLYYFTTIKK